MNELFNNKGFLLFMFSRCTANIGDSIYFIVLLWTVQVATNSTSTTGFVYAAFTIASLFGVAFGPLVDKYYPAVIAGVSLFAQALIIIAIMLLQLNNSFDFLSIIIILVFVASLFSTLFYPADNTLFTKIVEEDSYLKGNAIISSSDQVINLIGFLAGGVIISYWGTFNSFLISVIFLLTAAVSYIVLLKWNKNNNLYSINKEKEKEQSNTGNYIGDLKQGLSFIRSNPFLKTVLPFGAVSNATMAILIILLPSIGVRYGSSLHYSGMYVAFFIGFIIGALLTNLIKASGKVVSIAWIGNGLALSLLALVNNWWLTCVAIVIFGTCSGVLNIVQNTLIQSMTPPYIMGRVMSAISTINNIGTPLGALIGGVLAISFSLNTIMIFSAVMLFSCGFLLLLKKQFREFNLSVASQIRGEKVNFNG
ncbi:putative MFS family arabinose efflux permease [Bacillus sp. V-88]|jgi:MFS transporter, DHA3 family, macrolide efflux protein|nr:hypothetical protein B1B00_16900 [Bacillus sp. DSM 27956]PRX72855.1 putative MFS family arabinose efflux permease [Bacillus sp. V-88]SLK24206.1 Predicted arabinose efflux permease, MFS family [Bacillus sp. V-88]